MSSRPERATAALATLAVIALALVGSPTASALCMAPSLVWSLITPAGATLAPRSMPLVAVRTGDRAMSAYDPRATELAVTLESGAVVRARIEPIVPGLARLVPPSPWPAGAHRIEGLADGATFRVADVAMPSAPAAPRVRSISRHESMQRREIALDARAELAAPVPAGVIAIAAQYGTPDRGAWSVVTAGDAAPPIFSWPGRCAALAPGHWVPETGERVALSFVDVHGQRSSAAPSVAVSTVR